MAHNFSSGFFVGTPAWHKLGTVLASAPADVREAIQLAGMDWDAVTSVPQMHDGRSLENFARVITRSDTGEILSVVGPRTTPLQNREAFAFFQPFLDAQEATLETAGCLSGGKKVWVLAKVNRPDAVIVPGDSVGAHILLSNSHDGSLAVRVGYTPIRVVCQNTLSAAHSSGASKLIRIRHTASVAKNVENVRSTMDAIAGDFNATADQYRFLASRAINQADVKRYVKTVLDMPADDVDMSTRSANILDSVLRRFDANRGIVSEIMDAARERDEQERATHEQLGSSLLEHVLNGMESEIPTARGSYWTAYNAVTSYLTHEVGRSDETRLESLWYGKSATVNSRALDLATTMAKA